MREIEEMNWMTRSLTILSLCVESSRLKDRCLFVGLFECFVDTPTVLSLRGLSSR